MGDNQVVITIPPETERQPRVCIYKAPTILRKINPAVYTPRVISIGPIHRGKKHLEDGEKQKQKYYKEFEKKLSSDINLKGLQRIISKNEMKIRQCYADGTPECDDFEKMVLVDAIFIIEILLRDADESKYRNDFIVGTPWLRNLVRMDLILLENQLPYFILKELYEHVIPILHSSSTFFELVDKFFSNYKPNVPDRHPMGASTNLAMASAGPGGASTNPAIASAGSGGTSTSSATALASFGGTSTNSAVTSAGTEGASTNSTMASAGSAWASTNSAMASAGTGGASTNLAMASAGSRGPSTNSAMASVGTGGASTYSTMASACSGGTSSSSNCPAGASSSTAPAGTPSANFPEVLHFTDVLRNFISHGHPTQHKRYNYPHSATRLHEAGVKFKLEKNKGLLEIKFTPTSRLSNCLCMRCCQSAELRIPCLRVDDTTEYVYGNLMALEQCHYPTDACICSYIKLMNDLIGTTKDVDLLVEQKIIVNRLGNNSAVEGLFNKLCLQIPEENSCYYEIATRLNDHYTNNCNRNMATLRRTYFPNIWRGTATFAATSILLLTLGQFLIAALQAGKVIK